MRMNMKPVDVFDAVVVRLGALSRAMLWPFLICLMDDGISNPIITLIFSSKQF